MAGATYRVDSFAVVAEGVADKRHNETNTLPNAHLHLHNARPHDESEAEDEKRKHFGFRIIQMNVPLDAHVKRRLGFSGQRPKPRLLLIFVFHTCGTIYRSMKEPSLALYAHIAVQLPSKTAPCI